MRKRHKREKFSVTVCGEFFPESYPAFRSPRRSRGEEDPLETELRLFCACMLAPLDPPISAAWRILCIGSGP